MSAPDTDTKAALQAGFADTLADLSQFLKFQKHLGNRALTISQASLDQIQQWGQPGRRPSCAFVCQGPKTAALMIIDSEGLFFDGAAGNLLIKILKAMKLSPAQVCICSPSNPDAIRTHVNRYRPKCLLCLGEKACALVNPKGTMGTCRGRFLSYENTPAMVTHHPSELLIDTGLKRQVWQDVQQVMARIGT
ncbi:MAG: uracil-DNA glycosylase [Desulfobacterales bacterium]|nr:MAG: uracil-DNA glycosylase [Desulfobacterales bacterium]